MTTSKSAELSRPRDFAEPDFVKISEWVSWAMRRSLPEERPAWPATQYQQYPGKFARDVLGVNLMSEQAEILEAIRDHRRVAVRGGRKVGKDFVLAVAALWFYACFPGARVRFTAVKAEQVDQIFWREVRQRLTEHGRCIECRRTDPTGPRPCPHSMLIPETPGLLARTGLKSDDFREIVGYTAREAEGAAGVSGGNQFYIVDEASAVDDPLIEAIEGNLMGSQIGRLVLISNPTRTAGQFYRAFHAEAESWKTFHRSSVDIARKYGGRIPGVATLPEIEALLKKYGRNSDFAHVHVDGNFPTRASGRIFDVHTIEQSQGRRASAAMDGDLCIGIDVAGESGEGDESAFSVRSGHRQLELRAKSGLKPEAHLGEALQLAGMWRQRNQRVVMIIDRGGEAGARVWGVFIAHRQALWQDPPFDLIAVDSSRKANNPKAYDRIRDELIANLKDWIDAGGGIIEDVRLAVELNAFRWMERRFENEPSKLVDKKVMRGELARSPDRADATALSVWGERHWSPPAAEESAVAAMADEYQDPGDPYADADAAMRMMRDHMMAGPGRGR